MEIKKRILITIVLLILLCFSEVFFRSNYQLFAENLDVLLNVMIFVPIFSSISLGWVFSNTKLNILSIVIVIIISIILAVLLAHSSIFYLKIVSDKIYITLATIAFILFSIFNKKFD